jgi:signal transduction histidine kinase
MRLIPDRISTRIAATVIAALVATQIINGLVYVGIIGSADPEFDAHVLVERMAATARVIDAAPLGDRPQFIAALSQPPVALDLASQPPKEKSAETRPFDIARGKLRLVLGDPNRDVLFFKGDAERRGTAWVHLKDGAWLSMTVAEWPEPSGILGKLALQLALVAAVVGPLSVWAARKISAPLATFAQAAETFGVDSGAPPLKEAGPRELRIATRTFNRMQERLRRFIDDRTRMLAAMSHDLRTPLTRLRLRAEFVEDAEQQQKMLVELDEMTEMIDASLAFAREDARREEARRLDLGELVATVCDGAVDAHQDVAFELAPRSEILGRPGALRRAVANVVDNAVKYAGAARVRIVPMPGEFAVEVDDSGPGIPEAERERVFAPFYRIESSRNRGTGGVGLGLAVARSIAREHGGDISLANREEGGLRLTIIVPRFHGAQPSPR